MVEYVQFDKEFPTATQNWISLASLKRIRHVHSDNQIVDVGVTEDENHTPSYKRGTSFPAIVYHCKE